MTTESLPQSTPSSTATVADTNVTKPERSVCFRAPPKTATLASAIVACIVYTALAKVFLVYGFYAPGAACAVLALICLLGIYMIWSYNFLGTFGFGCAYLSLQIVVYIINIIAVATYDCSIREINGEQSQPSKICKDQNAEIWILISLHILLIPTSRVFFQYAYEIRLKQLRARRSPTSA